MFFLANYYFNSIKVQLEPKFRKCLREPLRHFNSIKVQLEPTPAGVIPTRFSLLFQFHKGTIRTKNKTWSASAEIFISIP